ncbi:MAG: hypothetical protein ACLSHM_09350 [Vescimonas sp.]
MQETLDLGLTIDERLADGYYYSKSIRLLKYLLEHPEELEKPYEGGSYLMSEDGPGNKTPVARQPGIPRCPLP